jgi:hypothetical protein
MHTHTPAGRKGRGKKKRQVPLAACLEGCVLMEEEGEEREGEGVGEEGEEGEV